MDAACLLPGAGAPYRTCHACSLAIRQRGPCRDCDVLLLLLYSANALLLPLLCAGLGWGMGMGTGLGLFNPEALVYRLLSSGPPPLRCTRPAGYGSLTCLKADKSPRSPVDTSPRTNPEPSHIPALFPPLRFLHLVLPSSPRVFPSSLVSANPQNPPRRLLLALDQFPWYLHNRPAGSTSSRTAREKRTTLKVDCTLLGLDRVQRPVQSGDLQSHTARITLITSTRPENYCALQTASTLHI